MKRQTKENVAYNKMQAITATGGSDRRRGLVTPLSEQVEDRLSDTDDVSLESIRGYCFTDYFSKQFMCSNTAGGESA